jgi:hypothetical protein
MPLEAFGSAFFGGGDEEPREAKPAGACPSWGALNISRAPLHPSPWIPPSVAIAGL